jgi:hypothetical protein
MTYKMCPRIAGKGIDGYLQEEVKDQKQLSEMMVSTRQRLGVF